MALFYEDPNNRQFVMAILMNQVAFHGKVVRRQLVLGRGVEVELEQLVLFVIDGYRAAGSVIYLNGVPVVQNSQGHTVVVEFDLRGMGVNDVGDIDGGLAGTGLTSYKLVGQVSPVAGAQVSIVGPMHRSGTVGIRSSGTVGIPEVLGAPRGHPRCWVRRGRRRC